MAAKSTPKKEQRPRLDAVIRHIKAGSYDGDWGQLQGAMADRQRVRQEAIMGMVKEVFGPNHTIAPILPNPLPPGTAPRPRPGGPIDPELAAAEARARAEEALRAEEAGDVTPDPLGDDEEAGIESRSPMIGSIDSTAPVEQADPGPQVTIEVQEAPQEAP